MKKYKFKWYIVIIIICTLIFLPLYACASETSKDEDGIYSISSAEDLIAFSESVNSGKTYTGQTVNQMCDIDLAGVEFTPIGLYCSGNYFYGTYNGNGYTISNLYIVTTEYEANNGLFGMLGGTVINLNLNGYVSGNCCGSFASHAITNRAKIINCHSSVMVVANRSGGIADNFIGYVYGCSYFNYAMALPIISYDASCVMYSYSNSNELLAETFNGEEENNFEISSIDEIKEYVDSNLASVAVNGGVKISKLTKYGVTEKGSFFDSLKNYTAKTLKVYVYPIIAIIVFVVAIVDLIVVFVIEIMKHYKRKIK